MGDESDITETDLARYRLASEYIRPRDRVIDLGCGSDAGLNFLRRNSAGLHFIGIGIGIESSLASISDHSVDLVLAFGTLERFSNPAAVLQEIRRVLIPGGRLILSTSNSTRDQLVSLLSSQFLLENLEEGGGSLIATAIRDPLVDGQAVPYRETVFANLEASQHLSIQYARWYLNPWIAHSMVHVGYRVKSPALLATLATRLLESSPIDSADYGAALCILAYQQLEKSTDAPALESFDHRIGAYLKVESDNPHVLRWRISLTSVLAQLQLKAGRIDAARQLFQTCSAMDPFPFSTHLATKTADAFFWSGWLAVTQNDTAEAQRAWTEGVAFGDRLLKRPMNDILINVEYPNIFDHGDGMREFVLAMESITKCANGLHLLGRLREGIAVDWRNVHMTFRERGDRLDQDLKQTRLTIGDLTTELKEVRQDLVDRTTQLDACREDLITRTAELDRARDDLIHRTAELDVARRDLIERTRQLEMANQELIVRTADLDLARKELVGRTADLDISRAELIQRTSDLDAARHELVERTSHLDAARQELVERTADLDAARQELIERTKVADALRQDLVNRSAELAAARKRGRFWRFRLVD